MFIQLNTTQQQIRELHPGTAAEVTINVERKKQNTEIYTIWLHFYKMKLSMGGNIMKRRKSVIKIKNSK